MNRLETEIENHRIRAIMCENVGNKEEAKNEWYLYDCLSALKNIHETGDCNTCMNCACEYKPKVEQMVRYNCPFYEKDKDNGNSST